MVNSQVPTATQFGSCTLAEVVMRRAMGGLAGLSSLLVAACHAPSTELRCEGEHEMPASHALQCGPTLDFTEINAYRGDLPSLEQREGAVVLVQGACSGTWIEGPDEERFVLTAGHCVGPSQHVLIAFNHELCPDGLMGTREGRVVEHSEEPDYALIAIDAELDVVPTPLSTEITRALAIIQHPRGRTKVIAEGQFAEERDGMIHYVDLDTLVGGSGAGILNANGDLIGIHTDGDCDVDGGTNYGWSIASIVEHSELLTVSVLVGSSGR